MENYKKIIANKDKKIKELTLELEKECKENLEFYALIEKEQQRLLDTIKYLNSFYVDALEEIKGLIISNSIAFCGYDKNNNGLQYFCITEPLINDIINLQIQKGIIWKDF